MPWVEKKRKKKGALYIFVLKLLLSARSHKETERASQEKEGGRERQKKSAAAHEEAAGRLRRRGGAWKEGGGGYCELVPQHVKVQPTPHLYSWFSFTPCSLSAPLPHCSNWLLSHGAHVAGVTSQSLRQHSPKHQVSATSDTTHSEASQSRLLGYNDTDLREGGGLTF